MKLANVFNRFRSNRNEIRPQETNDSTEEKENHQWDRPIEFVLSLISNSVGLGNVWRFPYLAAKNGGGAFLIPYFSLYFLIGAPLYFLELGLGQFTSRGPATGFVMARGWRGVGIAMVINSILGTLYYNVIIAWAVFYFVLSFRSKLLWTSCNNFWNTNRCFVPGSSENLYYEDGVTWNCTTSQFNSTQYLCVPLHNLSRVTVTEEFYYRLLVDKSSSFDDFGVPGLYMSLCLLVAWIIICLCIFRGVQSSGKVAYFTAIFPYIVLLVLIIFTATLSGARDGIVYYVVPVWSKLGDLRIWQEAASQVFFSLSLSFGSLIAYSAANKFDNNFFKQMCIVVSCDCFTGVFAGFAVFATIGFLAKSLDTTVSSYADSSGPGLAFITYPEALAKMPAGPFFSIIFFMMLLALGLGSQFASTDVIITALMEFFPKYANRRSILVVITCLIFFLVSLPFACPGGLYLFELFQEYTANTSLVFVGFFEIVTIAYIYGYRQFLNDIQMMLGRKPARYYLFLTWCISAPLLTFVITLLNLIFSAPLEEKASAGFEDYQYPLWSTILGWFIFIICIIPIPAFLIYVYIQEYRRLNAIRKELKPIDEDDIHLVEVNLKGKPTWLSALILMNRPAKTWGPKRSQNHVGRYRHLQKQPKNEFIMKERDTQLPPVEYPELDHIENPAYLNDETKY